MSAARWIGWVALASLLVAGRAGAGPAVDLHRLRWYVHVDLIDSGTGRTLAFWQNAIDEATTSANRLLEGRSGPFDRPCCTRLARSAAVTTFGSPGDGRDVLDSLAEQNYFNSAGANGSNVFLIDSMTYCGGVSPAAVGCAERPACDSNGGDNPNLWMVVTADAFDDGVLASVVAHERGHNACLVHVANDACQIMQATVFVPGLGTCLAASECTSYRTARTTSASGLMCGCQTLAGAIEPDATLCATSPLGLCSGGVCDQSLASPAVKLIAAGAPGTAAGGPPDDAFVLSAGTGHWSTLGQFTPTADDVRALEYAHDSATLYGVVPTVGDDRLVTIDPATGLITATVGTLANGTDEVTAMAYDPGATSAPSDDRLLVLVVDTDQIARLRAISPSTPSSSTLLGSLTWTPGSLFTGLAYDSIHHTLFAATPFGPDGLYRIDLASCTPSPCDSSQVSGAGLFRDDASLSFSPATGMLYLVGTAYSGQRTFYDVVDPVTGTSIETLSLDLFTPAGLAAVPEPFGRIWLLPGVLGVIVAYRARHGRNLRQRGRRSSPSVRSRGVEGTMMRLIGRKALGGVVLGMALAAFVGCGQGDKGGSQSAGQAVDEAASDVAAGVEGAAEAVGDSAAQMGAEAQDAAAAAGAAVSDTATEAAAGVQDAAAAAAGAVEAAGESAAAAVDSAAAGVAGAADQAKAAATDAGAAAAGAAAGALDSAAQEAEAAKKALEQPAQ